MVITHQITIEQYEAWLATNPSMSALRGAVRSVFKIAYRTIARVKRFVTSKRKSCLAAKRVYTIMPLDYNRNAIGTRREEAAFAEWRAAIFQARVTIGRHIERHEMKDRLADTAWAARVENELAMEQLHAEALEILVKN